MSTPTSPEQFDTFGALLRYLRIRAHLSQRELAIAVGYSEAHLSRLEHGRRRPDPDVVRAHVIPALGLEAALPWATRLLALAEAPHAAAPTAEDASTMLAVEPGPSTALLSSDELLATKFYPPRVRPGQVPRLRLTARLDGALATSLAVVVAPAGFGKTSLLADWLSGQPHGTYLALDSGDNDPVRFLRYLVAALRNLAPQVGTGTLSLLEASAVALPALLQPLLNDLASLPHPVVLVLDDYHAITAGTVHEGLAFLVERLPPHAHLVLASREDPPLPLARLRAQGQLVELRAAQLRFTGLEAGHFLRETMALSLGDAEVTKLAARTEGWAAGLQLAALALQEQEDVVGFVQSFAGTNRFVLDYLAEEILGRLPEHLLRFLLFTAVLERMCGELCDAVLELEPAAHDSYSRLVLAELERRSLFLVPLDDERRWYRYHHLFGDVLRGRLEQSGNTRQVAALHRRASSWFAVRGLPRDAVHHAHAGGDWEQVAQLTARWGEQLLDQGEDATVRAWLDMLPSNMVWGRPRLGLLRANLCFTAHDLTGVRAALDHTREAVAAEQDAAETALLRGEVATLEATLASLDRNYASAIEWSDRALAELSPLQLRLRGRALLQQGIALGYCQRPEEEEQSYAEALRLSQSVGDLPTILHVHNAAGVADFVNCRLSRAEAHYRQGLQLAEARQVTALPIVGMLHANYAELLAERNQLDQAEAHARAAMSIERHCF